MNKLGILFLFMIITGTKCMTFDFVSDQLYKRVQDIQTDHPSPQI